MKQILASIVILLAFSFPAFASDHCPVKNIAPWLSCDSFEGRDFDGDRESDEGVNSGEDSESDD